MSNPLYKNPTAALRTRILSFLLQSKRGQESTQIAAALKAPLVNVITELLYLQMNSKTITGRTCDGDADQNRPMRTLFYAARTRAVFSE